MNFPKRFYVYAYLRENQSENGPEDSPYYIGKGFGRRAWLHFKGEVYPPTNKNKIFIIAEDLSEYIAFELEKRFISMFGRIDLKTGCLQNKTSGGEGTCKIVRSEWHKKRNSEFMKEKWKNIEYREKILKAFQEGNRKAPRTEQWKKAISKGNTGVKKGPKTEQQRKNLSDSIRRGFAAGRIAWNKKKE